MNILKKLGVYVGISSLLLSGCSERSGSQANKDPSEIASKPQSPKTPYQRRLEQANAGDTTAQFELANMYATGDGVPQAEAEAVKWYRLAAEQGNELAQYNLGVIYSEGQGVVKDYVEAYTWYRLAAEQGSAAAQYNLGVWFDTGLGVPQDYAEAVKWYSLAAEQGNYFAQYNLGLRHAMGEGVPQDTVAAYAWFSVAAASGYADAAKNRDVSASQLSPDQLLQAQQRATELFEKFSSVK